MKSQFQFIIFSFFPAEHLTKLANNEKGQKLSNANYRPHFPLGEKCKLAKKNNNNKMKKFNSKEINLTVKGLLLTMQEKIK